MSVKTEREICLPESEEKVCVKAGNERKQGTGERTGCNTGSARRVKARRRGETEDGREKKTKQAARAQRRTVCLSLCVVGARAAFSREGMYAAVMNIGSRCRRENEKSGERLQSQMVEEEL